VRNASGHFKDNVAIVTPESVALYGTSCSVYIFLRGMPAAVVRHAFSVHARRHGSQDTLVWEVPEQEPVSVCGDIARSTRPTPRQMRPVEGRHDTDAALLPENERNRLLLRPPALPHAAGAAAMSPLRTPLAGAARRP
jgi:hypothetical protein